MNHVIRRTVLSLTATCALLLAFAAVAFADAPDVKVPPTQSPTVDANATLNPNGTVTVTVTGGWSWPTHGKDCNTDRAGAGIAIAWFDPKQPGNDLGASVNINGVPTPIFVGTAAANALNPADNVVHPTENDTGSGAVADISTPAQFAQWRGGCGVFSPDQILGGGVANVAHGYFGRVDPAMPNYTNPIAPSLLSGRSGALLSHTYASVDDLTKLCAVTYDVHSGTKPVDNNGVGIPGNAKEVTAGGNGLNDDNGVTKNSGTPAGNACPAFVFPKPTITTNAGGPYTIGANGTVAIHDVATLSNGTGNATGSITFKLFSDANCQTQVGADSVIPVNGANGQQYTSGDVTVSAAGTYHWTASYSGDGKNLPASSPCGAANENPVVNPRQTTLTTDAGGPYTIGPNGTVAIHDIGTLSGGTSNATGSITFKLWSDANCTVQVGNNSVVTVNNGADGKNYQSGDITVSAAGTYHWTASYNGDTNNLGSTSGCGAVNENPVVNPRPTNLTTDAGGPYSLGPNGTVAIHDIGTLTGGTSNAGGTITFRLFSDANCTVQVGNNSVVTVNNGADGKNYQSGDITVSAAGTYHWTASYSGDTNNQASSSGCGAPNENPQVNPVGLSIVKTADDDSVETGDQVGFTITVTGSGPALDVVLDDNLPAGPTGNKLDWSIAAGGIAGDVIPNCSITGAVGSEKLRCNSVNLGTGANGQTSQSYTVHIVSSTSASGPGFTFTNTATASSSNHPPVSDDATIEVVDLDIEKHADQNQVPTGTTVGYTITVTGSGPAKNVTLNDPLPAGPAGNELNWSITGPITGDVTPSCQITGAVQAQTLRCSAVNLGTGADFSTPQSYTVHITSATNPNGPGFTIKNISTASSSNHKDVVDDDTAAGDTEPLGPGTGNTIEVGAQLVLPSRVTPGTASLNGPTGCVAKAFSARVRGTKIATVVFKLDGKVVKRVNNKKNAKLITLRVNPAKFRIGVHRLVATVTFQRSSGTKARTIRLSFQRCSKKLAAPRFTG